MSKRKNLDKRNWEQLPESVQAVFNKFIDMYGLDRQKIDRFEDREGLYWMIFWTEKRYTSLKFCFEPKSSFWNSILHEMQGVVDTLGAQKLPVRKSKKIASRCGMFK